jgi:hypothetical protein
MCEQQYQAEVMDQLKQEHDLSDRIQEAIRKSYILGWEQGMQDAKDMYQTTMSDLMEKKNG